MEDLSLDLNDLEGEIWKEIEGYDCDYQVSNFGRVKSFKRYGRTDVRIIEPWKNGGGYFVVCLHKKGKKQKTIKIHILMYENHIGKIPAGYVVHHIDFTKNDFLENFQMMTNGEHSSIHKPSEETRKLMSETKKEKFKNGELNYKGEHNPNSTLTEQDVIEIRMDLNEGILTQKEIGEKFGVSHGTISMIKTGKSWKHVKEEK